MSTMGPGDPASVDDALGADHARLGGLLEALVQTIQAGSGTALEALERFTRDLRVHMDWEEQVLFPAVRSHATAAQARSIESLEIDHERLRDTLSELEAALRAGDGNTAKGRVDWVVTLLKGHNYDEEHGVYVEADRYLAAGERSRMLGEFERRAGIHPGPPPPGA